jgi:hypothetical protein
LSSPGHRSPDDLLCRIGDIGSPVDEGGILAAKFEQNGRQILGGRVSDDLAGVRAAGEEDEVER